jgi:hypothetical protein
MARTLSELICASSAVREMKSTAEPPCIGIPAASELIEPPEFSSGVMLGPPSGSGLDISSSFNFL